MKYCAQVSGVKVLMENGFVCMPEMGRSMRGIRCFPRLEIEHCMDENLSRHALIERFKLTPKFYLAA